MKSSFLIAPAMLMAAISAASAQQVQCTGPFAQCASEVTATCSLDPDGVQRMTYFDGSGSNSMVFQRCVGNVYVSRGFPNPYDSGAPAGNAELPFPRTTLNYPTGGN